MCCKLWQYIWEIKRFMIQSLCLFWVWLSTVDPSTSQISLFLTWIISHSWFLSLRTFSLSPLEGHDYQHLHKTFSSTRAEETFKAINICTLINSALLANMGFFFFLVIITIIMMFKPVVLDFYGINMQTYSHKLSKLNNCLQTVSLAYIYLATALGLL